MSDERLERWRLVLGKPAEEGTGQPLAAESARMDRALASLYGDERKGGLGGSRPYVAKWLGEIRDLFPRSAVELLQRDAVERLDLRKLLLEPELLETVQPDVHLAATLLTLRSAIPDKAKEAARNIVRQVVREVEQRLRSKTIQAVRGAIDRSRRSYRPRPNEIDWDRTIRANLNRWLPEQQALIPERLVGHGRKRRALHDVVLCVDQSGSMAGSVVYSGIFGAILASLPALRTRMVVFDTAVVDLTEELDDPVELLFGTQLGGGTDICQALTYCEGRIERPAKTVLFLITDLFEGGDRQGMLRRLASMTAAGVRIVCLLALDDAGAPVFDRANAEQLAGLGIPAFACTPDLFPDLVAAALAGQDVPAWAARNEVVVQRGQE